MAQGSLPVMVVGFDGLMRLEQDFTTDMGAVRAALHRVQDRTPPPSESIALERATRTTIDDTMQLFHAGGGSEILARNTMDNIFANVQTVGLDVVDTFYVRDWNNELVTDVTHRAEIQRFVGAALASTGVATGG